MWLACVLWACPFWDCLWCSVQSHHRVESESVHADDSGPGASTLPGLTLLSSTRAKPESPASRLAPARSVTRPTFMLLSSTSLATFLCPEASTLRDSRRLRLLISSDKDDGSVLLSLENHPRSCFFGFVWQLGLSLGCQPGSSQSAPFVTRSVIGSPPFCSVHHCLVIGYH